MKAWDGLGQFQMVCDDRSHLLIFCHSGQISLLVNNGLGQPVIICDSLRLSVTAYDFL